MKYVGTNLVLKDYWWTKFEKEIMQCETLHIAGSVMGCNLPLNCADLRVSYIFLIGPTLEEKEKEKGNEYENFQRWL